MSGKRKASNDAPGSARPPPPRRRRGGGNDDEHSSLSDYSEDSRSDRATLGDDDERSSLGDDHVGGGDSNEESQIADLLASLNLPQLSHVPAEAEVQPPPPADHPEAAEVADQPVAEAAPAPEMVVPAADSVLCSVCGLEPASVRLVPVEHACLCLPCHSIPSGLSYCEFCDGPRR